MRKQWITISFAATLLVLAACGDEEAQEENGEEVEETEEETELDEDPADEELAEEEEEESEEDTVQDALGEEIEGPEEPERIISLMPSNTETAFALGLGDQLVGVTDWCDYPEEAQDIESVGDMEFDVETALALEPDVVLAHESNVHNVEEGLDTLGEEAEVVVVNDADSLNGAYEAMEMIGEAAGAQEAAEDLITEVEEGLNEVAAQAEEVPEEERVSVWYEVDPGPEIFTTGSGTFAHEMIELINAENAAADEEGWISLTEEEAVTLNPDVIITTYGDHIDNPEAEVSERTAWDEVEAVANDRIYDVDADKLNRPGPRLVEGAEMLGENVYPEVFGAE
ncbi:ABC transporter substrate-binding protein [Salsuginibacillus kocurii]|uniref:ABC transporter substrate-binding protein n=1 Tax=Salsuginibacillus kocurii TaxID=427078 RepID=UPI0003773AD0|nr:ABC transporter substrate-binding protein [Salsuginibacillus kocurii]